VKVLSMPDLLIFLDASFATCNRRKALNWLEHEYLNSAVDFGMPGAL
jgi:hypothetical protein